MFETVTAFFTPAHLAALALPCAIIITAVIFGQKLDGFIVQKAGEYFAESNDDDRKKAAFKEIFAHAVKGISVNICIGLGLYWIVRISEFPAPVEKLITCIIFTNIAYTVSRTVARILGDLVDISFRIDNAPGVTNSILTNCVKFIVYAVGLLIVLQYYDISITPFITALGVGGMAVALGLQDTLSNLFGGFHLLLSRQLRIGDYVKLNSGEEGRVTDIALRFTTVVTFVGNDIVIPNSKLAASIITNYNRPQPEVAVIIPVGVDYGSDLEKVERVTLAVAAETFAELGFKEAAPSAVRFNALADSSINFNAVLYTDRIASQGLIRHTFIKKLVARFRAENINIPFPVRTVINAN